MWSDIGTSLQTWMLNKVMHQALNQNKSCGLHRVVQFSRNNRRRRRKCASSCVVSKCHYCRTSPDIPPQLARLLYTRHFIVLLFCVCDSSVCVRIYVERFCFAPGMFAARQKATDCLKCRNVLASGRHGQKGSFYPNRGDMNKLGIRYSLNHPSRSEWNVFSNGLCWIRIFQLLCLREAFLFWSGTHIICVHVNTVTGSWNFLSHVLMRYRGCYTTSTVWSDKLRTGAESQIKSSEDKKEKRKRKKKHCLSFLRHSSGDEVRCSWLSAKLAGGLPTKA